MQQNPLRYRITLEGVVQGVGFRPFTKRLADRFDLPGITFNTAGGLIIEIETDQPNDALRFLEAIKAEAPAAAQIEQYSMQQLSPVVGYKNFQIMASAARDQNFTLISTDLATCPACLEEMRNQSDRRFRYPFTNLLYRARPSPRLPQHALGAGASGAESRRAAPPCSHCQLHGGKRAERARYRRCV